MLQLTCLFVDCFYLIVHEAEQLRQLVRVAIQVGVEFLDLFGGADIVVCNFVQLVTGHESFGMVSIYLTGHAHGSITDMAE